MKTLDLLGPCYCLASCLVQGDVADTLLDDVDKYIDAIMHGSLIESETKTFRPERAWVSLGSGVHSRPPSE